MKTNKILSRIVARALSAVLALVVTIPAAPVGSAAPPPDGITYYKSNAYIETYFGTGRGGLTNGNKYSARFLLPHGVATGSDGLYVFDTYNNAIRKISNGKVSTITGAGKALDENRFPNGYYVDGALSSAMMSRPVSGSFNSKGELVICDSKNNAIRLVSNGQMRTLAGGKAGFADGTDAKFRNPMAIAIEKDDIYVADTLNNCIRKIDKDGNVATIAGTPKKQGFADGEADKALFCAPSGIAVKNGVVYVSDTGNHRIRKIENGIVTTIAGFTDERDADGYPLGGFGDGAAARARFNLPMGLAFAGEILVVADSGNNMIRAVTSAGYVYTVAGDGEPGDADGSAAGSVLCQPAGVCFSEGILYIADTGNNKIKRMRFDA